MTVISAVSSSCPDFLHDPDFHGSSCLGVTQPEIIRSPNSAWVWQCLKKINIDFEINSM